MGPMTGRAAGYCAGYNTPGFMNAYGGRMGLGFRGGRGRRGGGRGPGPGGGWYGNPAPGFGAGAPYGAPYPAQPYAAPYGAPYAAPYSAAQEKEALQTQMKIMEEQMTALRERLEELDTDSAKES